MPKAIIEIEEFEKSLKLWKSELKKLILKHIKRIEKSLKEGDLSMALAASVFMAHYLGMLDETVCLEGYLQTVKKGEVEIEKEENC